MKQKWLKVVTKYNQRVLKNLIVCLGPQPWTRGAYPVLLLHAKRIFQIRWVIKNKP